MKTSSGALRRIRGRILLAGASGLAIACLLPGTAPAATYFVSNEIQLTAAINAANADGDPSSSIVMTNSFGVTAPNTLPVPTKSLSLDTQGFTLSGTTVPSNPGTVRFSGGTLTSGTVTLSGNITGANQSGATSAGGGLIFDSGVTTVGGTTAQLVNNGVITGGAAAAAGASGGIGVALTNVVTLVNNGTVTGGTGGTSGGLGNNGSGVNIFSSGATVINNATGTIQGGNSQGAYAGAGVFMTGTAAKPATLVNYGTIRGGSDLTGNSAGNFAVRARGPGVSITNYGTLEGGNGSAAIGRDQNTVWNVTVINNGTIRAGAGSTTAILFGNNTGSKATLELWAGSQIIGDVLAGDVSPSDTLRLGGSTNSSFDVSSIGASAQYRNFELFEKTGTSTWALTGTGTATTNWTVSQGTLQIGNGGTTGSIIGDVSDNATLAFDRSDTYTYGGVISGSGGVSQIGSGTTVLTGANTYGGGTTISNGVLSVSADTNLGAASGGLTFNGGGLQTTSAFTSSRNVTLTGNGTFQTDADLGLTGVISGSGLFTKTGAGTLTLSGNNSYTGGTRILGGTLEAEGGNAIGDQSAVIAQAGVFRVLDNETIGTLSGDAGTVELVGDLTTSTNFANTTALFYGGITGTGGFVKNGAYRQVLAGNNSYQGATQILAGTLYAVGTGIDSIPDASAVTVAAGATLSLARPPISSIFTGIDSDDETIGSLSGAGNVNLGDRKLTIGGDTSTAFSGSISGTGGSLAKLGDGTLTLSGMNTYTGATTVNAGRLRVDGSLGNTAVSGPVTVDGTIAPGDSHGTLTVGSLTLNAGAKLDYELGVAGTVGNGVNDLIVVNGDLTLDGTLNVTDVGGFGPGVYRLMDYGGAFTDNGLVLGSLPAGVDPSQLFVQTSIAGEVNLISSAGVTLGFWDGGNAALHDDGTISGGDGVWHATNRNWTEADGAINGKWGQDFAVFAGQAGTVTVDDSAGTVGFTGMQFMTDGYVIDGDTLTTNTAATTIRTDAAVTATIAAEIAGTGGLVKTDSGTLVLSGTNTYSGGTTISTGTLIGQATSFGTGNILDNAALVFNQPADATFSAIIDGTGTLTKTGAGNLNLTGINTLSGATTIEAGKLSVNGSLANSAVTVLSGGALGGNGTVGNTTLQAGGVIAPGNSIG
ncbi:beta strand repeat-containing protein [Mesorhizobium sp. RCC_202]|uniref:beta strand repeat-containing protein n=1 Tax=Mesorhizobium sp. RCC_202 TaxID=3239222 RepID=UPI003525FA8B